MPSLKYALPLLALAACTSAAAGDEAAPMALVAGDAVLANDPALWVSSTYDDFVAADSSSLYHGGVLPDDAPVARRLQAWSDGIDAKIRAAHLARTGTELVTPRPIVKVLRSHETNAWVSSAYVCPNKPRVGADQSSACIRRTSGGPSDEQIVAAANAKLATSGCEVVLRDDAYELRPRSGGAASCAALDEPLNPVVSIAATSPYIHVTTTMLARVRTEKEIVAILAHELGHYFRAHPSAAGDFTPFWYEQPETPSASRPTPAPDNADLVNELRSVGEGDFVTRVAGQMLNPRLTHTVHAIASIVDLATFNWPANPCPGLSAAFNAMVQADLTDKAANDRWYLDSEATLLACGGRVRLRPMVRDADGQPTKPPERVVWAEDVKAALPASIDVDPSRADTVADFLYLAESAAHTLDLRERVKATELDRRHLGEYTAEQEADDFSLEWAAAVGLASNDLIDLHAATLTSFFQEEPDQFSFDGIEWPACMELYRQRFRDPNGRTHFVPLGYLHDPHHGACYRIFNLVRANEAHHFATSDFSLPSVDWSALRHDAEVAETGGVPVDAGAGAADAGAGAGDAGAVPARRRLPASGAPRIIDRW